MAKPSPDGKDQERQSPNNFMKYSGMAFQMAATIAVGLLLGGYLDRHFQTARPYFTALCALVFTVAAIYLVIKDFLKAK